MKNTNLFILALITSAIIINFQCDSRKSTSPINTEKSPITIVSPAKIRSGEYLPIVVHILKDSYEIDTGITGKLQLLTSSVEQENSSVSIKKGAGSLTKKIVADNDINISIKNMSGTRQVMLPDTILKKSYVGTINTTPEAWDERYDRYITGDLIIPAGTELLIKAGTRILLGDKVNILINGTLVVEGTENKPVQFISIDWNFPWGGIEIKQSTAKLKFCFLVNGGADESRVFGHSQSQPVLKADHSEVDLTSCYLIDNVGKALGAHKSRMNLDRCLISRCDTGGEFHYSLMNISYSYILDIPDDNSDFVDDDNDGFYFAGVFSEINEPSKVNNCFIITGKDDAIDHNAARLEINNCRLEGFMHEGVAGSNGNWVKVYNTLVKSCEQGIEAGYGNPKVYVDHCVVVDNDIGFRFGDSYQWGCQGEMIVTNSILYNNGDNVHNFDLKTQAPVDSGIIISYSMTNDLEYNHYPFCITGVPLFDATYHLTTGSPGKGFAKDSTDMGLIRVD